MKKIKIIEVRSEVGAGTRGAGGGVDALRMAAQNLGSSFYKDHESVVVEDENHLLKEPVQHDFAKRIKGILEFSERLAMQVRDTRKDEGCFPVVLAGDHTSAIGTGSGLKMAAPEKRIGVIWIDAHADIHSPYTTPSGNMHGMPIAALLGEDNFEMKVNQPIDPTIQYWEKIKSIGDINPKIRYNDIVMIGVRDCEKQELGLLDKNQVKRVSVADVRKKGEERIALEAINALAHCDSIYVSFDVDSMDPEVSKGTGTPVPGGFTEKEAATLITHLMQSDKIACFEMVEINPSLDEEKPMAEAAIKILLKATDKIA